MAKIIGNTTATPTPRSDWNQTDVNKADFIMNKPILGDLAFKNKVSKNDLTLELQSLLGGYQLTDADKREIANIVIEALGGDIGGGDIGGGDDDPDTPQLTKLAKPTISAIDYIVGASFQVYHETAGAKIHINPECNGKDSFESCETISFAGCVLDSGDSGWRTITLIAKCTGYEDSDPLEVSVWFDADTMTWHAEGPEAEHTKIYAVREFYCADGVQYGVSLIAGKTYYLEVDGEVIGSDVAKDYNSGEYVLWSVGDSHLDAIDGGELYPPTSGTTFSIYYIEGEDVSAPDEPVTIDHYYFDDADLKWYEATGDDYEFNGRCPNCNVRLSHSMQYEFETICPACEAGIVVEGNSIALGELGDSEGGEGGDSGEWICHCGAANDSGDTCYCGCTEGNQSICGGARTYLFQDVTLQPYDDNFDNVYKMYNFQGAASGTVIRAVVNGNEYGVYTITNGDAENIELAGYPPSFQIGDLHWGYDIQAMGNGWYWAGLESVTVSVYYL